MVSQKGLCACHLDPLEHPSDKDKRVVGRVRKSKEKDDRTSIVMMAPGLVKTQTELWQNHYQSTPSNSAIRWLTQHIRLATHSSPPSSLGSNTQAPIQTSKSKFGHRHSRYGTRNHRSLRNACYTVRDLWRTHPISICCDAQTLW